MAGCNNSKVAGQLRVERGGDTFLGRERVRLLEQIAEHGSIAAAAKALNISYRSAWSRVNTLNNLADEPVVACTPGGRQGGGAALTEHGHRMVRLFRLLDGEYQRFLGALNVNVDDFDRFEQLLGRRSVRTSARNQFQARVIAVECGTVNAEITLALNASDQLVARLTRESLADLAIAEGVEVYALIKASSVMLATDLEEQRRRRWSRLPGKVATVVEGPADSEVTVRLTAGKTVAAVVAHERVAELDLRQGAPVWVLIDPSQVILGVHG